MQHFLVLATTSLALAATAISWPAHAATPGFYAGGSYQESGFDANPEEFDAVMGSLYDFFGFTVNEYAPAFDDEDSGYEFLAGYRLLEWLALEAGYLDLGAVTHRATASVSFDGETTIIDSKLESDVKGIALSALGIWQATERLSVYGRAGLMLASGNTSVRLSDETGSFSDSVSDSQTGFLWGVGAGFEFADIYTVRLEYRQVMDVGNDVTGKIDADSLSLGLIVAFGF